MLTVDTARPGYKALSREDKIRKRAQQLFRERGSHPETAIDDWLCAEMEIREMEERAIDEASEDSFPASDPPAH